MWSGPVSPPTNSRLLPISALSSCRSNSPRSTMRPAAAPSRPRASAAMRDAASRSDGPELNTSRRRGFPAASAAAVSAKNASGHRLNGLPALTCRTASSSSGVTPARASRSAIRASAAGSSAISTRSRVSSAAPPVHPGIASSRSHWFTTECRGRRSRGRWTARVYIQRRPWMSYPMRSPAPLAHVSHALRGPPCRSSTRSNRSRRSRRARARSSAIRRAPRVRGAMMTSSRCGLCSTHRRPLALDQIRDRRIRVRPPQRPDERRREHDVADQPEANQEDLQGSIIASSISITGMSSLIG